MATEEDVSAVPDKHEVTPGEAAHAVYFEHMTNTKADADTWRRMGEHQAVWERMAKAAIAQHIGNSDAWALLADKAIIGNNTGHLQGILNAPTDPTQ